ncbi:glycosyltransferase family 2 protein [Flavobacterium acetivorans]|uniref:glycosyltransferase family 2 protein n=1 Tax=Flavobacterium acetivorans TaxID=2893883 RepID=UPI001E52F024|nr:glycosyltransferase [Flavobacterium sp. F-29]UFH35714.1 glycosyltransferase [Flavobacterium sp. F-29]
MISVVIRNKNQSDALSFLLKNLTERYRNDINEIIVIDNLSTDNSKEITGKFGARFVTLEEFSYGRSANIAASECLAPIIVIFSAHSYPVSHDFFKLIKQKFEANPNLAGLRCLHNSSDYKNFINKIDAKKDPNKSGLIFSGSAFSREVWKKHSFREDVATFEDKEWTVRVLGEGYEIDFVPAIFHYEIKRTKDQIFFRFKNDVVGNYQLWHHDIALQSIFNGFVISVFKISKYAIIDLYYLLKRSFFLIRFIFNKPEKF